MPIIYFLDHILCISYLKSPDVAIAGLLRSQNKQNNPETSNLWPARSKIGRILPFLPFTHHEPARARCCHDSTSPFHYISLLWISLTLMVLICFNQGWTPRPSGNPPRGEGGVPRPALWGGGGSLPHTVGRGRFPARPVP